MVRSYILIETSAGYSRKLVEFLKSQDGVMDAVKVTGPYDVVVVLQASDVSAIAGIVEDKIHTAEGVVRTTTCVSMK